MEKTTISARVDCTLKMIVQNSDFNHRDAYELGAKIIAIGDAENTLLIIDNNPDYTRIKKEMEYDFIESKKLELLKELEEL